MTPPSLELPVEGDRVVSLATGSAFVVRTVAAKVGLVQVVDSQARPLTVDAEKFWNHFRNADK